VGSAVIVEVDPVSDCSCCVLKALESMPMNALLLEGSDDAFNHSILLRAMRGYELLFEAITTNKPRVIAARKNQSIIGTQKEWVFDFPQRSVTGNRGVFQCGSGR